MPWHARKYKGLSTTPTRRLDGMPCPSRTGFHNNDQHSLCLLEKGFANHTALGGALLLFLSHSFAFLWITSSMAGLRQISDLVEWPYFLFHRRCSHKDIVAYQ